MSTLTPGVKRVVSDLIFEAAISKAITDKRELIRPSVEHFLSGGNVNGEFDFALKKLLRWTENKVIEAAMEAYAVKQQGVKWVVEEAAKEAAKKETIFGVYLHDKHKHVQVEEGEIIKSFEKLFKAGALWQASQSNTEPIGDAELRHEIENRIFYYSGNTHPEFVEELLSKYSLTLKPKA